MHNGRTPTRYLTPEQLAWQAGVSDDLQANGIYPPEPPQGYAQGGSAGPSPGYPQQGPTYPGSQTAAWAAVGQDVSTPYAPTFQPAAPSRGYPQPAASDEQTPAAFLRTQERLPPLTREPYTTIPSSIREPVKRWETVPRIDTSAPPAQKKGKRR